MSTLRIRQALVAPALALVLGACSAAGSSSPPPATGPAGPTAPATATPVQPAGSPALDGPPVTLRLAIADAVGRPSEAIVKAFAQEVSDRSGGKMTIVPTFDAAGKDFESGVVALLQHGDTDLALAASRAWDLHGERALQAFQAPFLIDNDALLEAVMGSSLPKQALDGMTTAVGLSLWPEDLRHLAAFTSCKADYRSVADVAGTTILVQPSAISRATAEALGAHVYEGTDRDVDASTCALQGIEAGMGNVQAVPMGAAPSLVGNVTLFPKLQVLAANRAAFDGLTATQQAIVRSAATTVAARALRDRHPDGDLTAAWCGAGGTIVLARPGATEAFRAAVDPVYATLKADGPTKALIDAIDSLKRSTTRSPGAEPCAASATPTFVPPEAVDTTGYQASMPPNGTYRRILVADDLIAAGLDPDLARANEQTITITLDNGRAAFTWESKNDSNSGSCTGTLRVVDHRYLETTPDAGQDCLVEIDWALWKPEPDGISFVYIDPRLYPSDHILLDYWVHTRIK